MIQRCDQRRDLGEAGSHRRQDIVEPKKHTKRNTARVRPYGSRQRNIFIPSRYNTVPSVPRSRFNGVEVVFPRSSFHHRLRHGSEYTGATNLLRRISQHPISLISFFTRYIMALNATKVSPKQYIHRYKKCDGGCYPIEIHVAYRPSVFVSTQKPFFQLSMRITSSQFSIRIWRGSALVFYRTLKYCCG